MTSILILSFSPLDRDPRVQRQIKFLKEHYALTAAGFKDSGIRGIEFIRLPFFPPRVWEKGFQAIRLKTGRFEDYYWNHPFVKMAHNQLVGKQWHLILANDLLSLPLAIKLGKPNKSKILIDAHEYEPLHFDDSWRFNFFLKKFWDYIARTYLPKADAMTTVCDSIAAKYSLNYGVSCSVITNATHYHQLGPTRTNPKRIRMIHHGICNTSRRLENMIELMTLLDDRFSLDMMLVPDNRRYFKKLVALAESRPNINIREPVEMKEIVATLNAYDIGLFLLSPKAFNYRMALPNKLFEYIQARLAVAIWPSHEMAIIVNQYGVGVVSDEFSIASAAHSLNKLDVEAIQSYKRQSGLAAPLVCAEQNQELLLSIVGRIL